MSQILRDFTLKHCKDEVPELSAGQIVKVHQKIKEGEKTRIQIFQGTIIAVNPGHGINSTFTVRKIASGVGVEKVFPIHSPNIIEIEVMRSQKVRQAKINYLRERSGKALRLKEIKKEVKMKTFKKPVKVEEKKEEEKK
jgi:large subunit ribosomal protein L19